MNNKLDPKVRRLMRMQDDPARLRADGENNFITATEPINEGVPITASRFVKRVLVRLINDEIPEGMSNLHWIKLVPGIYTVAVPLNRLEEIATSPLVEYVEAGRTLGPLLNTSISETKVDRVWSPPNGGSSFDGSGVVVGIIDFGLDFTLDDFRHSDGKTRVAYLWDQSLNPELGENSPDNFNYGVEYDAAKINDALNGTNPFSQIRHSLQPSSHGTHVAGIASSNGRSGDATFPAGQFIGAAPGATIIFVQPAADDAESTFTDSVHVAEAIAYIFNKALELGMPCVINMSLGQNGGSHDGESIVERAIDTWLEQPGRAFVSAAGNEHIWRGHAEGTLTTGTTRTLQWKVGGGLPLPGGGNLPPGFGDFTPNEMEIWYSSRDQLQVIITAPNGESTAIVNPGETELHQFTSGNRAFIDSERFTKLNGDARIYIEISSSVVGSVQTGIWQVELTAIESVDGKFDAWIERDARRPFNNFADQSFFVGANFEPVKTLGTPATARRSIAVANYNHRTEAPNDSSSRGPTRDNRPKPEIAAPGTDIISSSSLGGRPDGQGGTFPLRVPMSGTSMSAPHVAGIVALMLQKNDTLTAEQIQAILIAGANPPAGIQPFDIAWGFGRVDAEKSIQLVV